MPSTETGNAIFDVAGSRIKSRTRIANLGRPSKQPSIFLSANITKDNIVREKWMSPSTLVDLFGFVFVF